MITDMQLGIVANALGIAMLLLVVFFHYITVSQREKK
uniref:Dolichyl-diphosphooligosaccharide--protein glycosyltransferase subunit 4 n=1 Tax=Onchocerca volvulus TaxID=6282 RepID=A0A8R1U247_ONCVO